LSDLLFHNFHDEGGAFERLIQFVTVGHLTETFFAQVVENLMSQISKSGHVEVSN
jgi:hypothetical protein